MTYKSQATRKMTRKEVRGYLPKLPSQYLKIPVYLGTVHESVAKSEIDDDGTTHVYIVISSKEIGRSKYQMICHLAHEFSHAIITKKFGVASPMHDYLFYTIFLYLCDPRALKYEDAERSKIIMKNILFVNKASKVLRKIL